jgi:DNA-binding XRE family transcriptional regulator
VPFPDLTIQNSTTILLLIFCGPIIYKPRRWGLKFEQRIIRNLAVRIKQLRAGKGWSQERLAEEAGIHRTYLGGIECARRNPSLKNLIRIARALGVSLGSLFSD